MTPRTIPATAVPLKGCPFLEIMAKQTAPTPQMMATGKAKQQSVRIAKIPLIREIVAPPHKRFPGATSLLYF